MDLFKKDQEKAKGQTQTGASASIHKIIAEKMELDASEIDDLELKEMTEWTDLARNKKLASVLFLLPAGASSVL
ncbi:hypothetical protein N7517_001642 [Penicillium concentricum]|uniref:Uncharacterized protein n=1 Tax=Penicillium concentricum TaxID=293559 RepID=A0A9W9SS76_9EURO|nr:uncharacterized protein N7517_001642 [Penicillium concentricum]KAJ5383731.1 hypothetical protein N7517_001642 [Penicillium concentricum]